MVVKGGVWRSNFNSDLTLFRRSDPFLFFDFGEFDENDDDDGGGQSQNDESPGDNPEKNSGAESLTGSTVTGVELSLIATKKPFSF